MKNKESAAAIYGELLPLVSALNINTNDINDYWYQVGVKISKMQRSGSEEEKKQGKDIQELLGKYNAAKTAEESAAELTNVWGMVSADKRATVGNVDTDKKFGNITISLKKPKSLLSDGIVEIQNGSETRQIKLKDFKKMCQEQGMIEFKNGDIKAIVGTLKRDEKKEAKFERKSSENMMEVEDVTETSHRKSFEFHRSGSHKEMIEGLSDVDVFFKARMNEKAVMTQDFTKPKTAAVEISVKKEVFGKKETEVVTLVSNSYVCKLPKEDFKKMFKGQKLSDKFEEALNQKQR